MGWLYQDRDARALSFIAQGDWCDPMNMVGCKGKGVSGWLTVAAAYAMLLWAGIAEAAGCHEAATRWRACSAQLNAAANRHLWDGAWFARGITDNNVPFGIQSDLEGRIYLNPQSWAMLSGAASPVQRASMLQEIESQLETPHGVAMFNPPHFAHARRRRPRHAKAPGSAENGAVYNHAASFYIFALYETGESDRAYKLLRQMIPGPDEADVLTWPDAGLHPQLLPRRTRSTRAPPGAPASSSTPARPPGPTAA